MATDYPDDADGNALRRVAASGSNMSKPMDIDFQLAGSDEATARRVADEAAKLGYRTRVYGSTSVPWKCQCTKSMIPTYASLLAAQAELDAIARPLGANTDGWGTYGGGKRYTMSRLKPEPASLKF
jgi:regulator of RNase E activity RraB